MSTAQSEISLEAGLPRLRIGASVALLRSGREDLELKGPAAVVLAWIALEGHADRRRLSALLWPRSDLGQARNNLRVLTHRIHHRAGAELLVGAEHLALDPAQARVELLDADVVMAALAEGGVERCELLAEAGVEDHGGEELHQWLQAARQRVRHAQLARLGEALTEALALERHDRAARLARACVQLDPLSEQQHTRLMEVLARGGDRAAALAAYEACKALLGQHLGVQPGQHTRALQLRILQEQALVPLPQRRMVPLPGVPAAPCPLVEREAVLAQAGAALAQGLHVVVQGEPGVGKTRLLHHLAAAAQGRCERVLLRAALKHEPYAALAQLLQELHPRLRPPVDMPAQVELARLAPLAFAGARASEVAMSAPRLHAALAQWFSRLADTGVQLLQLDDVQYADAASQAALAALLDLTRDEHPRAPCLLLAHRSAEIGPVLEHVLTQAQVQRRARCFELQRLTPAGVRALLASMPGAPGAGERGALAQALHLRTGGNPLFVIELSRAALGHVDAADATDLQSLLAARLRGCGAAAQQLAAVAAVAASDFTVELAAAVTRQAPLALMPAWQELQQRGLFADQALAHDLVQDAVLAGLPQAIRQLLHRQVALHLEDQRRQGAPVLRHWLAAGDTDRALPHAAHHLYATGAAGLPTMRLELDLLDLLERSSDAVLMQHLWLSAEVASGDAHEFRATDVWHRLRRLRLRVEALPPQGLSAAWLGFESARDHFHLGQSVEQAQSVLRATAAAMPATGAERAIIEYALAGCAIQLRGDARLHALRARAALAGLPERASLARLRKLVAAVTAIVLDPAEGARLQAARRRQGLRRGDLGLVAEASACLAYLHAGMGSHARSFRHACRAAQVPADTLDTGRFHNPFLAGVVALNSDHFTLAQSLLEAGERAGMGAKAGVLLQLLHLRLGRAALAASCAARIDLEPVRRDFPVLLVHAHVCATLDELAGRDPVPGLRERQAQLRARGIGEPFAGLMDWELLLRTHRAEERLAAGEALLAALRSSRSGDARHLPVLLDVAEARADAGLPGAPALAAEAARLLRRGSTYLTVHVPQGLLRCARLLHRADAAEAAALVHVARRWVRQAMARLPPDLRATSAREVPVHRLLLGDDDPLALAQPPR